MTNRKIIFTPTIKEPKIIHALAVSSAFNFLKILKAVCLGCVHLPDIGQIPDQIIEQKLVQRCETHIDVQSCKAS